ncbi:reverse transcriptase domain-containing protein [Tanacetum coccineum]
MSIATSNQSNSNTQRGRRAHKGRDIMGSCTPDIGSKPSHGEGVYCYRKMPFGLKYAGATYQRLVDKVFNAQIERNLEAYVDDMVIKSTSEEALTESINAALFARREKGQAHTVAILTNSPIKQALTKPEKSGHIAKWAIELGDHDIMKEVKRNIDTKREETKLSCEWKLYTDGASSSDGSGAGLMLIDPEGKEYTYALHFKFDTTNNEAEYKALLVGLRIAQEMEIVNLEIFVDSQLLVNQVKGIYTAKQPAIREYLQKKETLRRFGSYTIEHVRRNQNKKAVTLSKLASMTFEHLTKEVLVEVLVKRSIEEKEVLQVETKEEESWITPIHEYFLSGLLLEDPKESRKIRIKAHQYNLVKGSCDFNAEARSMVVRITKQEYYWPSMHKDVSRVIQDYEKCNAMKKRAKIRAIAAGNAWPFSHWGVNILGPLPMALVGLKFLAIAIEHSTKWIEAKRLTTVSARHVERFVWEYVVCRFRVPQIILSKDDKHFREGIFADLCRGLKIT